MHQILDLFMQEKHYKKTKHQHKLECRIKIQ